MRTYITLLFLVLFGTVKILVGGGVEPPLERVDTQIMSDPGSPRAPAMTVPAPSEQCASDKTDWT